MLPKNFLFGSRRFFALGLSLLLADSLLAYSAFAQEPPGFTAQQPGQGGDLVPPPLPQPGIQAQTPVQPAPAAPLARPGPAPAIPVQPAPPSTAPKGAEQRLARGEKSTLNLKDTDLTALIALVSELTGQNFIVDPRVKGKVTVISSKALTADEVYQVFLSVLNVQGFAVIPGKAASKIVPIVNAKQDAVPTVTERNPGAGDEYVTRVIQVQNVSVAQLVPILRPLLSQQAHLAAYPASNVLIASGEAANMDRIVKIIERIDVAGDESIEVVPLSHASATEVARILQSLQKGSEKDQMAVGQPTLVADERTNSLIVGGGPAQRARISALIKQLDTPLETTGNTEVVYLKYAKAKELVSVLTGMSSSFTSGQVVKPAGAGAAATSASAAGGSKEGLSIQADESTNSLVINAGPDVMRSVKGVIRQLDVRRAQVLVEAVIAEISSNRATEFGVQWAYNSNNGPVGFVNFSGSGAGILSVASAIKGNTLGNLNVDGANIAAGNVQNNSTGFAAYVRALAGDGDTNILSTPSLVTMDNQEAEIVVGQNVPFITGSYSNTTGGTGTTPASPFQTIQRQDVGITLKVRPQINEGNAVKLDVSQEVSSLSSGTQGAADIITNKRSLKTTVLVDNGQVVVLGGLIDDNLQESEQRVPLLGDIPVLGWLFSYKKTTKVKRNLMVFLHPVILRDEMENATVSGDKYTYMRARELDVRERGVRLMSNRESPLMPQLDQLLTLPPPFKEQAPAAQPPAAPADEAH